MPPHTRHASLRATLLALVIFIHGVDASPLPASVSMKTFNNPIAQDEMTQWSSLMGKVGIQASEEQLIKFIVDVGSRSADLRNFVVKPYKKVRRWTGTGQGWGLFTYPNSFPHRLHIEGREGKEWRLLHRALDSEHDWMGSELRFRRVRGVYDDNTTTTRQSYGNFVSWMAREAFEDFPELEAVRVYYVHSHVVPPGQEKDDKSSIRLRRTVNKRDMKVRK